MVPRVNQTTGSVQASPAYTAQLLTLHQHRANNQYIGRLIKSSRLFMGYQQHSSNTWTVSHPGYKPSSTLLDFSDRTRTCISKLISRCTLFFALFLVVYWNIQSRREQSKQTDSFFTLSPADWADTRHYYCRYLSQSRAGISNPTLDISSSGVPGPVQSRVALDWLIDLCSLESLRLSLQSSLERETEALKLCFPPSVRREVKELIELLLSQFFCNSHFF